MSTCCQPQKTSFFTDKLWIESAAIEQWKLCSKLPGVVKALALPDLHPGRSIPIGCAIVSHKIFYPHLAGNDLGCGVSAFLLPDLKKASPDFLSTLKWMKKPSNESLLDEHLSTFNNLWKQHNFNPLSHFGTIGGGNHFAEIGIVDEVFSTPNTAQIQPLSATVQNTAQNTAYDPIDRSQDSLSCIKKGQFILLVHSGSRTLGDDTAKFWYNQFGIKGSNENPTIANDWWQLQRACIDWAKNNRLAIAHNISSTVKSSITPICDTIHNSIDLISGESCALPDLDFVYVHRKGASAASSPVVALPGSRGDFSYLLKPLQTQKSAISLAHGAGRKWARSDCKERLQDNFSKESLRKSAIGSRVICSNTDLLYEEAPQAYKKSSDVLKALQEHELATPIAKLRPLVSIKV